MFGMSKTQQVSKDPITAFSTANYASVNKAEDVKLQAVYVHQTATQALNFDGETVSTKFSKIYPLTLHYKHARS